MIPTMAILFADPPDWTDGNPDWYGAYQFPAKSFFWAL